MSARSHTRKARRDKRRKRTGHLVRLTRKENKR